MSSKRRFFSGKSLSQALLSAASHYKVEPNLIAYRERERKHGTAKSRQSTVIEVDPDNLLKGTGPASAGDSTKASKPKAAPERRPETAAPAPAPAAKVEPAPASDQTEDGMVTLSSGYGGDASPAPRPASPPPAEVGKPSWTNEEDEGDDEDTDEFEDDDASDDEDSDDDDSDDDDDDQDDDDSDDDDSDDDDDDDDDDGDDDDDDSDDDDSDDDDDDDSDDDDEKPWPRRRRRRERSPRPATPDHPPASKEEIFAAARESVALLVRLAGLDLAVELQQGEERLEIELSGPDIEDAVAEDGEVLEAIEYLAPRMMRAKLGYLVPSRVDCDGFRRERDEDLVRLAHLTATKVRESGKAKTLEPMNPADRRLVHVSLADTEGVVTQSVGDGFFKRVSIRPE